MSHHKYLEQNMRLMIAKGINVITRQASHNAAKTLHVNAFDQVELMMISKVHALVSSVVVNYRRHPDGICQTKAISI